MISKRERRHRRSRCIRASCAFSSPQPVLSASGRPGRIVRTRAPDSTVATTFLSAVGPADVHGWKSKQTNGNRKTVAKVCPAVDRYHVAVRRNAQAAPKRKNCFASVDGTKQPHERTVLARNCCCRTTENTETRRKLPEVAKEWTSTLPLDSERGVERMLILVFTMTFCFSSENPFSQYPEQLPGSLCTIRYL